MLKLTTRETPEKQQEALRLLNSFLEDKIYNRLLNNLSINRDLLYPTFVAYKEKIEEECHVNLEFTREEYNKIHKQYKKKINKYVTYGDIFIIDYNKKDNTYNLYSRDNIIGIDEPLKVFSNLEEAYKGKLFQNRLTGTRDYLNYINKPAI